MKKLLGLSVGILFLLAVVGCGKEGPMGPSGATGDTGITHEYTYSAIVTPAVAFGGQAVNCPEIVTDIAGGNISNVVVYANYTGDAALVALPGKIWDASTSQYVDLTYAITAGQVIISWTISSHTLVVPSAFNVYVTVINK
jgi:hypothetical protein